MKFFRYIITAMLLLATLMTAGCGEDKFVGTWYQRVGNIMSKSVITKDKNKDNLYHDAEWLMGYTEERVQAGRDANGHLILNYRYKWYDKFVTNVPMTEKDGKLSGEWQGMKVDVEYDEKTKNLICRNSKLPIVTEAQNEKNFDWKKVREEIKGELTKQFNEAKEKNNNSPGFKLFMLGEIEFDDNPAPGAHG